MSSYCPGFFANTMISKGDIILLASAWASGASFVVTQLLLSRGFGPYWINVSKGFLMSIELGIAYMLRSNAEDAVAVDDKEDVVRMHIWATLCGITNAAASVFTYSSLMVLGAGKASFLFALYILFTPMIEYSVPSLRTPLTCSKLAAVLCGLFGLVVLANCGKECLSSFGNDNDESGGIISALIAAVLWAANVICLKLATRYMPPQKLTLYYTVVAFITATGFLLVMTEDKLWPHDMIAGSVGYLLLSSFLNCMHYALISIGVGLVSAGRASLLLCTDGISAAVLGVAFLGQSMTLQEVAGSTCILIACFIVAREK